jgi:ELWxxDGT repeat protein
MKCLFHLLFFLMWLIPCATLKSQEVSLAYDINRQVSDISSSPGSFAVLNNKLYFGAVGIYGEELWEYDGASAPQMSADICPGYASSGASSLIVFNDSLFFTASDGVHWGELMVYDGIQPPQLFFEINPEGSAEVSNLFVFKNKLYFTAYAGAWPPDLWVYDGLGPPYKFEEVFELYLENPNSYTVCNDTLYFQAEDYAGRRELWRFDGNNAPDRVIKSSSTQFDVPMELFAYGDQLLFTTIYGHELCIYNTDTDIAQEFDLWDGGKSYPWTFTSYKNRVYFTAYDNLNGRCVWVYDEENEPSLAFENDINERFVADEIMNVANDILYFKAEDSCGLELWAYDGVNDPYRVKDINPGPADSDPYRMISFKGRWFFAATETNTGRELWELVGMDNAMLVDDIYSPTSSSNPAGFAKQNNNVYFRADDGIHGPKLWKFDGTNAPFMISDSLPYAMHGAPINFNDKIYFCGRHDTSGYTLWLYNGVDEPQQVLGFPEDSITQYPDFMTKFNGKLIFFTYNYGAKACLWEYTEEDGPVALMDWQPPLYSQLHPQMTVVNDKLYFFTTEIGTGTILWSYDGVNEPVAVSSPAWPMNFDPSTLLVSFNGKLYIGASNSEAGRELWEYDGSATPSLVNETLPGPDDSFVAGFIVFNDQLYYWANNTSHETYLYRYSGNGDPEQVPNQETSSHGGKLFVANDMLIISSYQGASYYTIWKFQDQGGTDTFENLYSGYFTKVAQYVTELNSKVYFNAADNICGDELWVYCPKTQSNLEVVACSSFVSPSGKIWTESGIYKDTIPNKAGCDSLITINLTINTVNTLINSSDGILTAEATSAEYQWLDCNNSYLPIESETESIFAPGMSGTFAVEITLNECIDTSECYSINIISLSTELGERIRVYPNPGDGHFTVELGAVYEKAEVVIYGIAGNIESVHTFGNTGTFSLDIERPSGLYLLKIVTQDGEIATIKLNIEQEVSY